MTLSSIFPPILLCPGKRVTIFMLPNVQGKREEGWQNRTMQAASGSRRGNLETLVMERMNARSL